MQTQHKDQHACVLVTTTDHSTLLLVVHDALPHAETMLRSTKWWDGIDVDNAMRLMRSRVTRTNEMAIFAFSNDASGPLLLLRRAMRALYDLGLTAQEQNADAHIVASHGERRDLRMETTNLLSP